MSRLQSHAHQLLALWLQHPLNWEDSKLAKPSPSSCHKPCLDAGATAAAGNGSNSPFAASCCCGIQAAS